MANKQAAKAKVDNLQEHLRILKSELDIVAASLNAAISQRDSAKAEYSEYQELVNSAKKDLESTLSTTQKIQQEVERQEQVLEENKLNFSKYCNGREETFERREIEVSAKEAEKEREYSRIAKDIDELNIRMGKLSAQEQDLLLSIEENKTTLDLQKREIAINTGTIDSQRVLFNEELARFDARILDANKTLESIKAAIEVEREKTILPLQNLKAFEEQLNKRKSDLDIYETRVRARWAYLFPDRPLNI